MFRWVILLIFIVLNICCCASDDSQTEYVYLTVASSPTLCYGLTQQLCIQAKDSNGNLYDFLDGTVDFSLRWGSAYEIIVEVKHVENPPADASSNQYRLVEILSVKEDFVGSSYDFLDVELLEETFTMDNDRYYFFDQPFTCAHNVDCDDLVSLNNTGGFVDIRFEYIGDAQIQLVRWWGKS